MDIEGLVYIVFFLIYVIFSVYKAINKGKKKQPTPQGNKHKQDKKSENLEDVLRRMFDEANEQKENKSAPKPAPVTVTKRRLEMDRSFEEGRRTLREQAAEKAPPKTFTSEAVSLEVTEANIISLEDIPEKGEKSYKTEFTHKAKPRMVSRKRGSRKKIKFKFHPREAVISRIILERPYQ